MESNNQLFHDCLMYLAEADQCMQSYKELDMYSIIFEASNPNIQLQQDKNNKAVSGATSGIGKAIKTIQEIISNIINSIKEFFQKLTMSDAEKKAYLAFKEAAAKDPALKNKKITVKDFREAERQYKELEKQMEDTRKAFMNGEDVDISGLMDKINAFTVGPAKGLATAVAMDLALNMASGSQEVAQMIGSSLKKDSKFMNFLENTVGNHNAKRFEKKINSLGKQVSLERAWMKAKGTYCTSAQQAIQQTYKNCQDLIKAGIGAAGLADAVDPRDLQLNKIPREVKGRGFVGGAKQLKQSLGERASVLRAKGASARANLKDIGPGLKNGSEILRNATGSKDIRNLVKAGIDLNKQSGSKVKARNQFINRQNDLNYEVLQTREKNNERAQKGKKLLKPNVSKQSASDFFTGKFEK